MIAQSGMEGGVREQFEIIEEPAASLAGHDETVVTLCGFARPEPHQRQPGHDGGTPPRRGHTAGFRALGGHHPAGAPQLHHGQPVRSCRHSTLLGRRHGGREHDGIVGVFVVGKGQRTAALAAGDLQDGRVVVVIAELLFLGCGGLLVEVKQRSVVEDGVGA